MVGSENPVIIKIIDAEIIQKYFGYWPSFHDASITKVTFESNPGYWAVVTFLIAAFEGTNQVDEKGYYKLVKNCNIELQFTKIKELEFDCFGHQNVILDLVFEENANGIQCTFNSSVGLDAFIVAEEVRVLSLTPTA